MALMALYALLFRAPQGQSPDLFGELPKARFIIGQRRDSNPSWARGWLGCGPRQFQQQWCLPSPRRSDTTPGGSIFDTHCPFATSGLLSPCASEVELRPRPTPFNFCSLRLGPPGIGGSPGRPRPHPHLRAAIRPSTAPGIHSGVRSQRIEVSPRSARR